MQPLPLALAALACVAACDASAAPRSDRSFAEQVKAVSDRMHARYEAARRVELAIAFGNLERARAEARSIATLEEPDVLPAWQPYFGDVRAAARRVDDAKDLVTAAKAAGALGGECARCHLASGAKVKFARQLAPTEDRRLAAQMLTHQWAAARMWEGVIGPSDERWLEGARLLAKAPLTITAESGELGIADDVARVRMLARRALTAKQPERAELYGELLATCAHCHGTVRDR
jgi:hypothetical protein